MQSFLNLFIFTDALHVSGGFSAHHQEHTIVHTASSIVNCSDRVKWVANIAVITVDNTWSCLYSCVLLMMGGGTAWNM